MRLEQRIFFEKKAPRRLEELTNPRALPLSAASLPYRSLIHFWPEQTSVVGPSVNESWMSYEPTNVYIEHVGKLDAPIGRPSPSGVQFTSLIANYKRQHRSFKRLTRDRSLETNKKDFLITNYAPLFHLFRYPADFRSNYYRFHNTFHKFVQRSNDLAERFPSWKQFIELEMPQTLPTREDFKRLNGGPNQSILSEFNTDTKLFLFEVWKWLGADREATELNNLSDTAIQNMNLFVRTETNFVIIPFALLESIRLHKTEKGKVVGQQPAKVQSLFLVSLVKTKLKAFEKVSDEEDEGVTAVSDLDSPKEETPVARKTDDLSLVPLDELFDKNLAHMSQMEEEALPVRKDEATKITVDLTPDEVIKEFEETEIEDVVVDTDPISAPVSRMALKMKKAGVISEAQYKRAVEEAKAYKTLPNPFSDDEKSTLADMTVITNDDLSVPSKTIKPRKTIIDKSFLSNRGLATADKYREHVLKKDIVKSMLSVQRQGIIVKDYKVERVKDLVNDYEIHKVTMKPILGRSVTVPFRIPVVDEDGTFMSNGKRYVYRNQRVDDPIRKVSASKAALTSYYCKLFIERTPKKAYDYGNWLTTQVRNLGLDPNSTQITGLEVNSVLKDDWKLPRIYTMMAKYFNRFKSGDYAFYFNYAKLNEFFTKTEIETLNSDQMTLIGRHKGNVIAVDPSNMLCEYKEQWEPIGTLPEICGIDGKKAPVDYAEMKISDKTFPIGLALGYYLGLDNLVKTLGCSLRRVPKTTKVDVSEREYALVFNDETWVFSRLDQKSMLVLAGLRVYRETLRQYSVFDFFKQDVYYRLLEEQGLPSRYLRELDTLQLSWMDTITESLLEEMGEPTDFPLLLIRATELLTDDFAPDETAPEFMRYRRYERIAGAIHSQLHRSIKQQSAALFAGEAKLNINPIEVWQNLVQDAAILASKDRNPIQAQRELEGFTYRGMGGRSNRSMPARTRRFLEGDRGTVSESTVDSGSVGVVCYQPPSPTFASLRGKPRKFSDEQDGNASLFSTSFLLAPGAFLDDPKRANFISIQNDQSVFAVGNEVPPVRTGYEQTIAHWGRSIYATEAKEDGKVVSVTPKVLTVEYKSGKVVKIELGTRYGTADGVIHPHHLVSLFKEGDKFEEGMILSYNTNFFEPDPMNPGFVNYKFACMAVTAIMDNVDTLEDGSVVSQEFAEKLKTTVSEMKTVTIDFDKVVHDLVKVGDHVDLDTVLCYILDPEVADDSAFDAEVKAQLDNLRAKAPKAGSVGEITKIDVAYFGNMEDMSENLREIVSKIERKYMKEAKDLGEIPVSRKVDTSFRLGGKGLDPNTLVLQFYITHDVAFGVGDKQVTSHQLKSVTSRVMSGINQTASGEKLDEIFGNTSIEDRMVESARVIGMTNRLLKVGSRDLISQVYYGTRKPVFSK